MKQAVFRVGQAAKDLGVSSYHVRRLCTAGVIEADYSGKQWQIPAAEIERLKPEGVPSAPKIVDSDDAEPSRAPNAKAASALLADFSPEMIASAEAAEMSNQELTVAKNKLERNKVRKDEAELEDFFAERQKRLQEQEEAERRRYEEQQESEARNQQKEAAAAQRQKFYSRWLEYALRQKPYAAPDDVELDLHAQVIDTLAKVDTNERDFVVRRLVDAAVERGLKTWKADEAKRNAIGHAIEQLPWPMRVDESWKSQAVKIAREALKDAGVNVGKEEMASLARTALHPLVAEFEHAGKIEQAVNNVFVDGSNYDELREGRELVREALSDLPNTASNRQIAEAQSKALAPVAARVAERIAREKDERRREEVQRHREQVLSSVRWSLPRQISDEDERTAIAEIKDALNKLPADASQQDMEKARDEVIDEYRRSYTEKAKRADRKSAQTRNKAWLVQYGLGLIFPFAQRMVERFDFDPDETAWHIDNRVRGEVRETLEEELTGRETEQEVGKIVREVMREIERCR